MPDTPAILIVLVLTVCIVIAANATAPVLAGLLR